MSIPTKVLNGVIRVTTIAVSLTPFTIATPLLSQTVNTDTLYQIADDTVAGLLADNDCAILTKQGFIIIPSDANADTDGDSRAERFCTPGFVKRIEVNEFHGQTNVLTQTDLNRDGTLENNETHVLEISDIPSSRQITPANYYVVISQTGTVNETNVINLVQVSEEEARALLEEIERVRTVEVASTPLPAPSSTPLPIQPPPPAAPAPQVQPPPRAVPALW